MKTLIAIPCRDVGMTEFWKDFISLRRVGDCKFGTVKGTLLHDTRNSFAGEAIRNGFDHVLWIDDDMRFTPDLMERMMADMGSGMEYVSALAFKRIVPTSPVIYSAFTTIPEAPGMYRPEPMLDYPQDSVFEIAASGFGCVMTSTVLLKRVWDEYGPPFSYHANLGEDLSFCWRVNQMGVKMYCDSRIKVGHMGTVVFDEKLYLDQHKDDDKEGGDTTTRYFFDDYARHMWRYYCSHLNATTDRMTDAQLNNWIACDAVYRTLNRQQQSIITAYATCRKWTERDTVNDYAYQNNLDRTFVWETVNEALRRAAVERGLIDDRKEVK